MALAAALETCWPQMLEVRLRKGSIFSVRPAGLKTVQWCLAIRGIILGSTVVRWVQAFSRRVPVVVPLVGGGGLLGLVSLVWALETDVGGKAVACVPPGVTRVAFVI